MWTLGERGEEGCTRENAGTPIELLADPGEGDLGCMMTGKWGEGQTAGAFNTQSRGQQVRLKLEA